MIDIFTYSVYLLTLIIVLALVYFPVKNKKISLENLKSNKSTKLNIYHFLAIIIISFVAGFRYYVGNDWEGYVIIFEYLKLGNLVYNVEFGYYIINEFAIFLKTGYELVFFVSAFISWFFIFKRVPAQILPLFIFFIFVDEYFFWSMNAVRQFMALGLFLFSLQYLVENKRLIFTSLLMVASLFHLSAILLLPLILIPFNKMYSRRIWLFLFSISLLLGNIPILVNIIEPIFLSITKYVSILSTYVRYFDSGKYEAVQVVKGGGYIFKILVSLFIIIFSKEVVSKYPFTKIYFILFFIGIIIQNLFFEFQLIARFNNYFIFLRLISISFIIYYYWMANKYRLLIIIICSLYFILFLVSIYNSSNMCSPYSFTFLQ